MSSPTPCEDKKGSKWCSKKLGKCSKDNIAAKCELTCGVCTASPPPPVSCEDKKGSAWCDKKTKTAKKAKKTCSDAKKAKKCELTCCACDLDSCPDLWASSS